VLTPRLRRAAALAVIASAAVLAVVPAPAPAAHNDRKVMLRNVYLGADLIPLAAAQNRQDFEAAAAARYTTVLNNDFARRAKALAREVRKTRPDLIALQEAAIWRRGPAGIKDGSATPANQIVYDSTAALRRELAALGMNYRVVRGRDWFDFEAPLGDPYNFDARLTQRDVILRRANSKVRIRKTFAGGFTSTFDVPTQVGLAAQKRGWVGIDGVLAGRRFRLVSTHLEAYSPSIAAQQMAQLINRTASNRSRNTILMGDFNSAPGANPADDRQADRSESAYLTATDAGFRNPFPRRNTCCFAEDLRQTGEVLDTWIDHILVRPRMRLVRSGIVGLGQVDGRYPSDHAGITGTLRLPK
jgi:endonuclease/exonuclease/phosphatase family metal-dependent hydrolase